MWRAKQGMASYGWGDIFLNEDLSVTMILSGRRYGKADQVVVLNPMDIDEIVEHLLAVKATFGVS